MTILEAIQKDKTLKTKSGFKARFVALLANDIPAPLVMEVFRSIPRSNGLKGIYVSSELESYYMNGKYLDQYENHMDLVITGL